MNCHIKQDGYEDIHPADPTAQKLTNFVVDCDVKIAYGIMGSELANLFT